MTSLTIAVDDHVLHRARQRALAGSTSVNAVLRDVLRRFADGDFEPPAPDAKTADQVHMECMLAVATRIRSAQGKAKLDRMPTREEIYAERMDKLMGRATQLPPQALPLQATST